jgi:alkylation response protein AidB-like acyl-CoA dehydrogenase
MQFGLSDEQQLIVGTVRRFIETELIPLEDEIEQSVASIRPRRKRSSSNRRRWASMR